MDFWGPVSLVFIGLEPQAASYGIQGYTSRTYTLGRPLGCLTISVMALLEDPIYEHF